MANTAFYDNPELDKMLRALEIELDQSKKLEMANDLAAFLDQEMPWVPLDTSEITLLGLLGPCEGFDACKQRLLLELRTAQVGLRLA